MLRDRVFKICCVIALAGLQLYLTTYSTTPYILSITSSLLLFGIASSIVIHGSVAILQKVRLWHWLQNILIKICTSILSITFFSSLVIGAAQLLWQFIFLDTINWLLLYKSLASSFVLIVFFTLIYEILFLTKERELDNKVVKQLDNELMHAELNFLKNELDPHFVYNSLMPLYYLIKNDRHQAELFTYKLMQVYQHFLQNRKVDFISFEEEMKFIKNYFYLLQIRFKDSLKLNVDLGSDASSFLIVPFTMQLLIENAIKHTKFDSEEPLEIEVTLRNHFLIVSNKIQYAAEEVSSTKVGLKNLRMRYKVLMDRNIYVYKEKNSFVVKVPLLRKQKQHDVSSHYRG